MLLNIDEGPLTEILGRITFEAAQLEHSLSLLLEDVVASDVGWVLINGANAATMIGWLETIARAGSEDDPRTREFADIAREARSLNETRNQVIHGTWSYVFPEWPDSVEQTRWTSYRLRRQRFLLESKEFTIAELRTLTAGLRELRVKVDALDEVVAAERFGPDFPVRVSGAE